MIIWFIRLIVCLRKVIKDIFLSVLIVNGIMKFPELQLSGSTVRACTDY